MEAEKVQITEETHNNQPENKIAGEAGLGFVKRDQSVKNEEEQGLLEFIVVRNDKTLQSMRYLIELKNIIAK